MPRTVALTGTPGTGKTTVAGLLPYRVIDVNALVREGLSLGLDPERGCLEADMDGLAARIGALAAEVDGGGSAGREVVLVLEGHFSHHFAPEAVVLRLAPSILQERLVARGYGKEKVGENLEAEALDVILVEAVELCKTVHEIDTTGKTPEEVAEMVVCAVRGEVDLPPGAVDWLEEMEFDLGQP